MCFVGFGRWVCKTIVSQGVGAGSGYLFEGRDRDLGWVLSQHKLYGGRRDAMASGDLAQALAMLAVAYDRGMVQHQRIAADVLAFEAGAPHAGAHPFDNQVAFEFSDGADDDHDGSAQRTAGVDLFAETNELDAYPVQVVEHIEEVTSGACDREERPSPVARS